MLIIWECSIRGRAKRPMGEVLDMCERFLEEDVETMEIAGTWE